MQAQVNMSAIASLIWEDLWYESRYQSVLVGNGLD